MQFLFPVFDGPIEPALFADRAPDLAAKGADLRSEADWVVIFHHGNIEAMSVSITGKAKHLQPKSSPGLFLAPVDRLVIGGESQSKIFPFRMR